LRYGQKNLEAMKEERIRTPADSAR
jgi:hypothetical protein